MALQVIAVCKVFRVFRDCQGPQEPRASQDLKVTSALPEAPERRVFKDFLALQDS